MNSKEKHLSGKLGILLSFPNIYTKEYILGVIGESIEILEMEPIKFDDVPFEKRHGLCFDCDYCEQDYGSKIKTCRIKNPEIISNGERYKCFNRVENDD